MDISTIKTGQALGNKKLLETGIYPYINAGIEPSGFLEDKNSQAETITIPSRGQGGAGHVGYQKTDFWCGPLCYRIKSNSGKILTKFLYYYLRDIQKQIVELRQTGSIPAVNKKELELVKVPIPSLSEQEYITSTLDKFDALVNDISIGLPAELQARRSQYEYYRGKLLTFREYAN
jgi:type I restriction enzyme S subunit